MTLFMALFTQGAMAQSTIVYMKDGSRTIQRGETITFYDSHGPSQQTNYWETWYSHNENFTYVFKPAEPTDKIKVTFNTFTAFAEPASGVNGVNIGAWALRLNDDYLYIYEGNGAVEANLIATLTGNTQQSFSVMTNGAITFKFVSNASYREEGWYATVELVQGNMAAQAPLIQRSTCSDEVEIFPTTQNARIIYSIGENDPDPADPLAPPTYEYTGPISFPEGTIPSTGFKVNAMSQLATGGAWSSATHAVFQESDRVPFPDASNTLAHTTITREAGTNTIVMTPAGRPAGLNDTYVVRYTVSTNGNEPAEPTLNNSQLYTGPITASVNGTIYKAKTFAVSCSNQCSAASVRYVVDGIYAPTPIIDFDNMTITAVDEGGTTFEIIYTLDGTMPAAEDPNDPDHMPLGIYSATQVSLSGLTPGQTVRALAYRSNDDEWHTCNYSYTPSLVVSAVYVPSTGSGTYNNALVLLDDREDHNWSYYSDETSPIKKLSPADIKITYYGNSPAGRTTMTNASENGNTPTSFSAVASGVAVNHDAPESQFIYLKTLEASNEDGSGGYPYTMIANPFQKRPVLSASTTERTFVVTLSNYDSDDNWAGYGDTPATVTVSFSNGSSQVLNGPSSTTPTTPVSYTITKPIGTTVTVYFDKGDQRYPTYCVAAVAYQDGEILLAEQRCPSTSGQLTQFTVSAASGNDANKYRGFYAWRIKSLSPGLTISGKSVGQTINADEEIVFETTNDYGNEVEFEALWAQAYVTTCSTSNGLSSAIASSALNDNVGYERNFVVVTGGTQTSDINNTSQKPVTISGLYPDGEGTISSSRYLAGVFKGNDNTKFENLYLRNGGASTTVHRYSIYYRRATYSSSGYGSWYYLNSNGNYYSSSSYATAYNMDIAPEEDPGYQTGYVYGIEIDETTGYAYGWSLVSSGYTTTTGTLDNTIYNAQGNDLVFGRGIVGYDNGVCVNTIVGLSANSTSSYRMRIESGTFNYLYFMGNGYALTAGKVTAILGSDYDRANTTDGNHNTKLVVNNRARVSEDADAVGSSSTLGQEIFKCTVKSGTFDFGGHGTNGPVFYIGDPAADAMYGKRTLIVEGGVFGDISGGYEKNGSSIGDHLMVDMRIKGGQFNSIIYGAAMRAVAGGHRRMVFTGGEIMGWIAGGCNGTDLEAGGKTYGNTYIYFGGNAKCDSNGSSTTIGQGQATGGNIFGAGTGHHESDETSTVGEVDNSTVVIADNAVVEHCVYGGGNYGYVASGTDHKSDVVILGGMVNESVFGGSNMQKGQIVNITMKDGTIQGNIYGGSNSRGTISGLATINVSGGTVNNIYGGGYGANTTMSTNGTKITVTDGTINNNIYGGGEQGVVEGAAIVNFEGGSVKHIYGAGKGTEVATPGSASSADVAQGTTVNVKGGVVNGDVYGGGEFGTVAFASGNGTSNYNSTVSISGGEVKGDVFGGGKKGSTQGATTVNISGTQDGTILRGNVYAGAYGEHDKIYVAGLKTLNISGGRIYGSVYGGSRNANDGNTLNATSGTAATSVTNICGGRIDQHVYAAGYYGSTKGSVYAFIGLSAINDAPNHSKTTGFSYDKNSILIGGNIWAGGDWGVFSGEFGAATITGNSNIYINGEGYSTNGNDQSATNYMNIEGSIFGSGTSCDAGSLERTLILSHYGADIANSGDDSDENPFSSASRQVNSIQRFKNVIFDDAKLGFIGQGKINSLSTTERYSIYEISENLYLANGSSLVMNVPSSQIYSFHSVTIDDAYTDAASDYHVVNYDGLGSTGGATDNKVRVNGGSYVEIKYIPEGAPNGVIPDPEENVTVDFETGDLSQLTNTNSGIYYTNDATYPWTVVSNGQSGFNGTFCMKSGNGGQASTESSITVTAVYEEDGTISFMGGCWGEGAAFDVCQFYIDDQRQFSTGNAQAWNTYSYSVSAGTHTFTWNYEKDYSVDPTGDAFFVNDIVFTGVHVQNSGEDPEPIYYAGYGQLEGFAHMMAGNPDEDATCAYARPKQSTEEGNILLDANVFNTNDGGWVSYNDEDNEYDANGGLVGENQTGVQLRYENHHPNMRDNSEYYRIWRKGSDHYTQEAFITAHAEGNTGVFKTVEVEVELPSWGKAGSYYRFDRTNNAGANNTLIDYGSQVMTFNGANYSYPLEDDTWMYWQNNATTPQVTGATTSNATVANAIGQQNGILNNPNLNFGLVIEPGLTMESSDVNYIINSDADSWLASVEKPFNCHDNNHKPTIKLVLTYSDELTANATLDPVLIKLVQCDAQGTPTAYVTIKLIISTSTEITTGFKTQMYARMDGSLNTREISTATVVLPTFSVAEVGEDAKFYLKKAKFMQEGGVVIIPQHGSSVICAETADGTALHVDRFAMNIGAQPNPDNSDDWRNVSGQQDAVQPSTTSTKNNLLWGQSNNRGVYLGEAKGRNPLSFGINLYYNANEVADAKTKMGEIEFTIQIINIAGGNDTIIDGKSTKYSNFTITAEVYRIGPGTNFYVDGKNGQDLGDENRAKFPDKAAKTVNFIFNRLGYMPGDNIIVVNELPINITTTWDGSKFQNNVKMYRYPGGHRLLTTEGIIDNTNNNPYMGPLVDVTSGELNMKGIIMDGMYAEATTTGAHNTTIYPTEASGLGNCTFDGIASSPLITISNGARVNLTNTKLQNNYNNSTTAANLGGAVHVNYQGILAMNVNNTITGNYNAKGGGVYVDGSLIVSDHEYIYNNYTEAVSSKDDPEQNNVMLEKVTDGSFRVVQLGTASSNDAYDALLQTDNDSETKIGVTKTDWDHGYDGYMPVVYAEAGTLSYLNDPYNTQTMVVHDDNLYKLERYTTTEHADSPRYLYWLGTWVTAVTSQPTGFQANSIDTPEELAWAISLVNGENGCNPNADLNFTLTGDINMEDNIWVPIGNETVLYNGTFEGNGHEVTGLHGTISRTDMGMFGRTDEDAVIQNMVVHTAFNSSADNLGSVVGMMDGGTLSNVEGAGENTNKNTSGNNGGLVGVNGGTIHSAFAVTTIKGGANMGGLVAVNNGDLFNAYSASAISDGSAMAGLVATNNGRVENCYDATDADVAFAVKNSGTIRYCYTAKPAEGDPTYVSNPVDGSTLEKHGTYDAVKGIKELGYMYGDNKVTSNGNGYVKTTHDYLNNHTVVWDGLLSVLNQWVADGTVQGKPSGLSTWNRPITQGINGDLPILAFPMDNCLGNLAAEDGKMLRYSAFDANNNGLDKLLGDVYADKAANIYLYQSATNVVNGTGSNKLSIHEDAALLQAAKSTETIDATVGVTFDNSFKKANDYFGYKLNYDWHMLSTPLSNAPMGITWNNQSQDWWETGDTGQVTGVEGSYMPDDINEQDEVKWDFYCYYEPQYHWINFKRNSNSHYHYDDNGNQGHHDQIIYNNETTMEKGKGYMMAISQDSYLNNTGTLNKGDVKIALTNSDDGGANDPTRDWGSNLVGNPYQAYLDLETVSDNTGYTSFYVYSAEDNGYKPYTAGQSKNTKAPSQYIHPHQAFFVLTNANDNNFKFTYNMATAQKNDQSYFRKGGHIDYPLINLMAENTDGGRNFTTIEVGRPELGGAEKTEALRTNNFDLYARYDQKDYKLLFTPAEAQRVAVFFNTKEDDTYTITWNTENGEFSFLRLIDNITGVEVDMLNNDHYTFEGHATDYAARFYILFNNPNEEPGGNGNGEGNGNFAYYDGYGWIINGEGILQLVDVTGRVLYQEYLAGDMNRVHLDNFKAGVYVLLLGDKAQKIVIK